MKGGGIPPDIASMYARAQKQTTAANYGKWLWEKLTDTGLVGLPFNQTPIGRTMALRGQPVKDQLNAMNEMGEDFPGFGFAGTTVGKGIRAFHGSPHNFDKFDLAKIGTGEGAQAYGHGLYFAENESVAKAYRDALASDTLKGPAGDVVDRFNFEHMNVRTAFDRNRDNIDATIQRAGELLQKARTDDMREMLARDIEKLQKIKNNGGLKTNPGNMYEVQIKADSDEFLDWDKSFKEQPRAVHELARAELKKQGYLRENDNGPRQLDAAMRAWRMDHGGMSDTPLQALIFGKGNVADGTPAGVADKLKEAGLPGIKYLDQGSRGVGKGTRNYVVFNPDIVQILRKYGVMGPAATGALAYGNGGDQ